MPAYPARKIESKFTYEDYKNWPEYERWEIIEGDAYAMSPAPSVFHQRSLGVIYNTLFNYLKGKTCEVFPAPIDVILPFENKNKNKAQTVVQPDIVVVCDKNKIEDKGIFGAPDFIVEILSPSSAEMDTKRKMELYEKAGVREYWIVDTSNLTLMVFMLGDNNMYSRPQFYGSRDKVNVGVFEDLQIDLREVFGLPEEEPKSEEEE